MALKATATGDGGLKVESPLAFKLSAVGLCIHNGIKNFLAESQPLVLEREEKWIIDWERDGSQNLAAVLERDVVANYEVMREVFICVYEMYPAVWSQGVPPLGDFEGAMIYTTAFMNFHKELYRTKGGKKLIRDWAHKEALRLRACFSHLHRLTYKTEVSRNAVVKVLKKLYVYLRSQGGQPAEQPEQPEQALQDRDDECDRLSIEDLDDEPIIVSVSVQESCEAPGLSQCGVKEETMEAVEVIEDSQCMDEHFMESQAEWASPWKDRPYINDEASSAIPHPDKMETLDYNPHDCEAFMAAPHAEGGASATPSAASSENKEPTSAEVAESKDSNKRDKKGKTRDDKAHEEVGLAEKQARLRQELKKKAKQDEIQKNTEKEEKLKAKHVAAEEKEKKRLARAAAKEEKLKGREKKTEPSTADAAESERRPAKKQRRSRVDVKPAEKPEEKPEKPEEKFEEKPEEKPADDAKRDRKAEKVKEAFRLIQAVGIAELQTELGNRQSYTLKPPAGAKDAARSTIGVLLTTQSFYVSKNIVDKNEWPECLSSLYKVDVKGGITLPWYRNAAGPTQLNKIAAAWGHAKYFAGWCVSEAITSSST